MKKEGPPLSWIFWHPHQGLWNWALVGSIQKHSPISLISKALRFAVVSIDTLILSLHALRLRVSTAGIGSIFKRASVPQNCSILYLDLGTHKEGQELGLAVTNFLPPIADEVEAYGFEANGDSYELVSAKYSDNKNIEIIHKALVHAMPAEGTIKLYKDVGDGLGDSIYRETSEFEEVGCLRLSDFLEEQEIGTKNQIVLLRMNIEGAELDVIEDLLEQNLHRKIDGYFGMWDDVAKVDVARDSAFRSLMAKNGISPFTFNGRDLRWSLRRKCIEYQINTCVLAGLNRINAK